VNYAGTVAACIAGFLLAAGAGAQAESACAGPAYDLARPFVGAWQEFSVTPEGERLEGRLDTAFEAGGCAIAQAYTSADGAFTFRSLGYVDAASGEWQETYVLSDNRPATYRWQAEGDDILIVRIAGDAAASARDIPGPRQLPRDDRDCARRRERLDRGPRDDDPETRGSAVRVAIRARAP